MLTEYLGNKRSRMNFEAGKGGEGTMRKCTGSVRKQIILKCTDILLTSVTQACS